MKLFMPDMGLDSIKDISLEILKKLDIKAVLLDVDDTIAAIGSSEPFDGVLDWISLLKENQIEIIIASNNFKKRVEVVALKLNIPYVAFSMKPFGIGFMRAKKMLKVKTNKNILVVGDQVFTDIVGANLSGMKSILLKPKSESNSKVLKFKRRLEK